MLLLLLLLLLIEGSALVAVAAAVAVAGAGRREETQGGPPFHPRTLLRRTREESPAPRASRDDAAKRTSLLSGLSFRCGTLIVACVRLQVFPTV